MARRSLVTRTARTAAEVPALLERVLAPLCVFVGAVGFVASAALAVIASLPPESAPAPLAPDDAARLLVPALVIAALLGWALMQQGQHRVRRRLPGVLALVLLVILPIVTTGLTALVRGGQLSVEQVPAAEWVLPISAWYTTGVAAVSLLAFLLNRARPRTRWYLGRGAFALVLVAPYAVLLALIGTGLAGEWLGEPFEDAMDTLGRWGLLLHVVTTWLLGDPSGS